MFAFGLPDWWSLRQVVIGVFVFMIIAVNNEVQRLINSFHQNLRNIQNPINSSLLVMYRPPSKEIKVILNNNIVLLFDTLYQRCTQVNFFLAKSSYKSQVQ